MEWDICCVLLNVAVSAVSRNYIDILLVGTDENGGIGGTERLWRVIISGLW